MTTETAQQQAPQAPQAAQAPQARTTDVVGGGQGGGSAPVIAGAEPSEVYEAFRNQRSELSNQLERLEDQRNDISARLRDDQLSVADRRGLEQRLEGIDQRIASTEAQLAIADANVARAAAVPGAIVPPPPPPARQGPPEEVFVLATIFMVIVLLPLSIAFARRIWRRSAQIVTQLPQDLYERFSRLDQAVDAIAIEVERIGEGQRYLTRLHGDQQRALGAGPAERIDAPVRERERQK